VYTVTALPPPCGIRAIESTLIPTIAQSSEEASLTTTGTLADCDPPLLPPPPHAMIVINIASIKIGIRYLAFIESSLCREKGFEYSFLFCDPVYLAITPFESMFQKDT
jgi:hypothetical protein